MPQNLLLLHGALGSKKQLGPLKQLLSEHFIVWSMNFEGHGGDFSKADFSMNLFAENVMAFMKENMIEHTHIFGYSMGGYVALTLATKHPSLIQSIVTLGTKFNWTPESAAAEVKMLNPDVLEQKVPRFAEKLNAEHQPADWKSVMHRTADIMLGLGNGNGLSNRDLSKINHKVCIGIGNLDKMVTITESQSAADTLPNGSIQILEGVEHPIERVDLQLISQYIVSNVITS